MPGKHSGFRLVYLLEIKRCFMENKRIKPFTLLVWLTGLSLLATSLIIFASEDIFASKAKFTATISNDKLSPFGDFDDWPKKVQKAIDEMTEKYGAPDERTNNTVTWYNNGPWKRTIIYREEIEHKFPKAHTDFVEQFINYKVPVSKYDELAEYDGSIICERTKGEISARCDKEGMNFLAINLAHEIATGKKSVAEAREFYAKTAMASMVGKESEYTEKLLFGTQKNTADPDEPMKMTELLDGSEKENKKDK